MRVAWAGFFCVSNALAGSWTEPDSKRCVTIDSVKTNIHQEFVVVEAGLLASSNVQQVTVAQFRVDDVLRGEVGVTNIHVYFDTETLVSSLPARAILLLEQGEVRQLFDVIGKDAALGILPATDEVRNRVKTVPLQELASNVSDLRLSVEAAWEIAAAELARRNITAPCWQLRAVRRGFSWLLAVRNLESGGAPVQAGAGWMITVDDQGRVRRFFSDSAL